VRDDDPSPEVEFVVGDVAPGVDEELPDERRRRERFRVRGVRLDLVAAAVVLGGSLLVVRAVSGGNGAPTVAATPTPSAHRTYGTAAPDTGSGLLNGRATDPIGPGQVATISIESGQLVLPPKLPTPTSDDPAQCPDGLTCYAEQNAAATARAAVRTAFPGAVIRSAQTVHLNSRQYGRALWFVQINARAGTKQILIRVQAPRNTDANRDGTYDAGDLAITYYEHTLQQYHIFIQVDGPKGTAPSVAALAALAGDVRLLADE
jgi:hypothetical protein